METVFGAEVCREGVSELGLYCDHLMGNRCDVHVTVSHSKVHKKKPNLLIKIILIFYRLPSHTVSLLSIFVLLMSYLNLSSPHSALSLSDVEERCKQAASLKLPLSRVELNTEEVRELFQVSNTNICVITMHHCHGRTRRTGVTVH